MPSHIRPIVSPRSGVSLGPCAYAARLIAGRVCQLGERLRREELVDLLPIDGRLAARVELAQELLVQLLQDRVVLRELAAGVLLDQEDQARNARVLREAELERTAEQPRDVERRVHPPELVQPVG